MFLFWGASKIEDLGVLYQEENAFFANTQVVNISNSPAGGLFGKLNIFNTQASSVSELTALFIKKNELPIEQDLSTNLVAGMEASTNNMAFKTSADTFEIMAWLMKNGGRRNHLGQFTPHQANLNKMPVNWGAQAPFAAQMSQSNPVNNANNGNIYGKNPTLNQGNNLFYKQPKVEEPFGTEPDKEGDSAIPKPDWFKPKIFKGKTKV